MISKNQKLLFDWDDGKFSEKMSFFNILINILLYIYINFQVVKRIKKDRYKCLNLL